MESVEFEALLSDVEVRLDRLKALYEQWFQGLERLEPTIARKEVERRMVLLRKEQPRNTALRFRFQTLVQRSTTLQTYWGRVARQIEEGTYRRDLMKARQSHIAARTGRKLAAEGSFDIEVDAVEDGLGGGGKDPLTRSVVPGAPKTLPPVVSIPPARPVLSPIAPPRPATMGPAPARMVSPFARAAPRPAGSPVAQSNAQVPPSALRQPAAQLSGTQLSATQLSAPQQAPTTATFARPADAPRPPAPAAVAPPRVAAAVAPPPPAAPPRAATAVAPPTPAPAAARPNENLSEQDVRRVYDRYAEARRKNNEPVVAYDTLAKNLREVAPKMEQKFGKPVDFEVVLKDGKVGLKPVPRG
jgi:hypothetical protein